MPAAEAPVHQNLLPKVVPFGGLKVREDTLYTNASGEEKSGIRKRADQNLQQAAEILARLLKPGEVIFYVAYGSVMPTTLEQLFHGWHTVAMPGALIVLTNSRIVILRTKAKSLKGWQWDQGILSAEWPSLEKASVKGLLLRILTLKDRNGQTERFHRINAEDAKKIKLLLENFMAPAGALAVPGQGIQSLCPKCFAALSPGVYRCPQCGQVFKDEQKLQTRGWLIPGGAYFYAGERLMGFLIGFVELILLGFTVVYFIGAAGVVAAIPQGEGSDGPITQGAALVAGIMLLVVFALYKMLGIYHCRRLVKKFIPA